MIEQWKTFADGYYEVSNTGVIRRVKPGRGARPGKLMYGAFATGRDYASFTCNCGGKRTTRSVHGIVAEAFIGPCPDGMEINHGDGDKTNNNASNLEYVSHIENIQHAMRSGLMHNVIPQAVVDRIRYLRSTGMLYKDIAKDTGVSKSYCRKLASNEFRTTPL